MARPRTTGERRNERIGKGTLTRTCARKDTHVNETLDKSLRNWLDSVAAKWGPLYDLQRVSGDLAPEEIDNRGRWYPRVSAALSADPFDIDEFARAVDKCWAMGFHIDRTRLKTFLADQEASKLIQDLVLDFPEGENEVIKRIAGFVDDAVLRGFYKPNQTKDWAAAALFASVILTALYPKRFVDYRRDRWIRFARSLGFPLPTGARAGHAAWIVWAGKFANELVGTDTYRDLWPRESDALAEPLWVAAGLCWGHNWAGPLPEAPPVEPRETEAHEFSEGPEKWRMHVTRERNRRLVALAKDKGKEKDPTLPCQACGFSFVRRYGERGEGYIEAHHIVPVSKLKARTKTKIADLSLLCANCHRIIHRAGITVDELKKILSQTVPS